MAWENIDDANRYLDIRQGRISETLPILKFEVYDGNLNHGFDYIINDTNLGVEHYFNKTIFDKLHFLIPEEYDGRI